MKRKFSESAGRVWEPPPGYMLYYRRLVRISDVESHAKEEMRRFDRKPKHERDRENMPEEYR